MKNLCKNSNKGLTPPLRKAVNVKSLEKKGGYSHHSVSFRNARGGLTPHLYKMDNYQSVGGNKKQLTYLNLYGNASGGFIALISAVIISLVLMVVVFSVSTLAFFSRFNQLDSEYKEKSSALAESCVDLAILKLI